MRSILLVEDDPTSRLVLSALLEDQGYSVFEASSFATARDAIAADCFPHDVVLLDQHLGDGRGLDLVPAIRARAPAVKIILVSADVNIDASAAPGVDHLVTKGLPFGRLLGLIDGTMK